MCAKRDRKPGFDSEFDGQELKIKLRGEIDHHSAAAVRTSLDEMIRIRKPKTLVIDMSAVDFMDSSGLGLIMGRYTAMQSIGGELCVLDPSPATEKIMNLAGLERIITVKRSVCLPNAPSTQRMERAVRRRNACHRHMGAEASNARGDGKGKGEVK